ncbi:hypothetical protein [Gordonia sp. NPDC127522]|uniref:hypothetical protein n=1 Tax=Gordonia sp. NPDC127522 TaxID=3345390 RepID=UPI00363C49F6
MARALLARPEVLLLDEATAQLDARTESAITAAIYNCPHTERSSPSPTACPRSLTPTTSSFSTTAPSAPKAHTPNSSTRTLCTAN